MEFFHGDIKRAASEIHAKIGPNIKPIEWMTYGIRAKDFGTLTLRGFVSQVATWHGTSNDYAYQDRSWSTIVIIVGPARKRKRGQVDPANTVHNVVLEKLTAFRPSRPGARLCVARPCRERSFAAEVASESLQRVRRLRRTRAPLPARRYAAA